MGQWLTARASAAAGLVALAVTMGACAMRQGSETSTTSEVSTGTVAGADSGSMGMGGASATGSASGVSGMAMSRPTPPMQSVLDAHAALGPRPIETLTPEEARRQPTPADAVKALLLQQRRDTTPTALVPGVMHRDRTVPGAAGPLPARVYTPEGAGPFPVIVYFHGGGWVIGSKEVYDGGARGLSKAANAVVVSVDYRLAPEHKFPAQHEDALAAYRWAVTSASEINGDPRRVALAGESAGGNLAVATAVAARDAGVQAPVHVLSVYPIAQPNMNTPSYNEYANAKPLNRPMMAWFAQHTARTPADLQDPRISLVKANLRGLPPVTIVTAEIDPLRDDGGMLEQALRAAGVSVERRHFDGVTHEFFGMAAVVPRAMEAQQYAGQRLQMGFAR
ncbi:MAG TPA: alpha/beta hydrolase [Gemmatimonadaceae bacterium]|nr:alpha/beta hydrolase [Gemmatimonadaceae bacterium]